MMCIVTNIKVFRYFNYTYKEVVGTSIKQVKTRSKPNEIKQ